MASADNDWWYVATDTDLHPVGAMRSCKNSQPASTTLNTMKKNKKGDHTIVRLLTTDVCAFVCVCMFVCVFVSPCDSPCSAVSDCAPNTDHHCSQHGAYPQSIMSKIDWEDSLISKMAGSVKAHSLHILIASGSDPNKWPEEVTNVDGSYAQTLDRALKASKSSLSKVRLSLSDAPSLDAHGQLSSEYTPEELDDPQQPFDLLIFPTQIRVTAVRKDQINEFVEALGKWLQELKATSSSSSSSSATAASVAFPLPNVPLPGTSFLICSHKLRDKRCGVTGPILVEEIDKTIANSYPSSALPSPIHTFKVSHIGGHKYAGNVIVYPSGIWYGRVLPCHVPHLILAHCPEFELVDSSSGERRVIKDQTTVEAELAKLKPLIRGRVDPL